MEEDLFERSPQYKIYKDNAIFIGSFIGGPLVAGYLAATNFKKFGQFDKAKFSWIIAILVTMLLYAVIFLVPDFDKVPRYVVPLIYSGAAQVIVKKYQEEKIKAHISLGGLTYSNWRVVGIGLLGLVALFLVIFIAILAFEPELFEQL